jgi:hypothetical protein
VAVQPTSQKPTNANVSDVFLISPFQLSPQPPLSSVIRYHRLIGKARIGRWAWLDGEALWSFADSTVQKWGDSGVISHSYDGGKSDLLLSLGPSDVKAGFGLVDLGGCHAVFGLVNLWWRLR